MALFRPVTLGRPSLPARRPVRPRFGLPRRYTRGLPPTVLDRQRRLQWQRQGGPPPFVAAVQRGAARVAAAIRASLLAVRARLAALPGARRVGGR